MKFSPTRWVKNAPVAERAIEVWEYIVERIKFFLLKPPSQRPKESRSFDNLVKYHLNPLLSVQLHLFKDMATILNGFLVFFQTDARRVPFLSMQIGDILHRLMRFFVPKHVLKTANSPLKLQQIDVQKSENIVGVSQIKLSTDAALVLEKVPSKLHDGLKKGFLKFLKVMIKKIQEKSEVKCELVRNAACLKPVVMSSVDPEALQKMLDSIVDTMHKIERIISKDADTAKEQNDYFLSNEVSKNLNDFKNFDFLKTRLDEFMKTYTLNENKFWDVCKYIFILSHGQSSVEQGFNINKDALKQNMDTSTIEALRVVLDEIIAQGNIKTFQITKFLYKHCKLAHSQYKEDQINENKDKQVTELTRKREILQDDLLTVKKKKSKEENLITTLTAESDSYVKQAAAEAAGTANMKLLILKAQSFKDIVKKKKEELISLTSTIENMEG